MSFYHELPEEDKWLVDDPDGEDDPYGENLVAPSHGCPDCGERDVDYLQILEDAEYDVHCLSCDTEYSLPVAEPDIDSRREDYYQAGISPPNPNPL